MTRAAHAPAHIDTAAEELRTMIGDLTRTRSHREHLTATVGHTTVGHSHFTKVPPLLAQLQWADWTKGTDRSGTGYESRPAASIEALDTLVLIDLAAARWVRDLGEDDPSTTIGCVKLLGGLLPSTTRCRAPRPVVGEDAKGRRVVTCCTWHGIEHDVSRWWTQARLVTGWDAPAWRPDNTCPNCGERRTLRIRLEERIGFCTACRETWPSDAYQVLADHIRAEAESRVRVARGPCMCAWPRRLADELQQQVRPLAALCPRCGSATCEHAVRSTGKRTV